MTAPAWIFVAAFVLQSAAFVLVAIDRGVWQQRATKRAKLCTDLMARHAALVMTLRAMGHPMPDVDVVDVTDLRRAETVADILRVPNPREGL